MGFSFFVGHLQATMLWNDLHLCSRRRPEAAAAEEDDDTSGNSTKH